MGAGIRVENSRARDRISEQTELRGMIILYCSGAEFMLVNKFVAYWSVA